MNHFKYLTLASLLLSFAACKSPASTPAVTTVSKDSAASTPATFSLSEGQLSTTLILPGVLAPYQTVDLYAKENSFVKDMFVDVGSTVQKGQLLATLEAPELETAIKEAASLLHTREALFNGSKATWQRLVHTSRVPGTISPNDLDNAYAKMSADSADLLAARSHYQQATELSSYLEIRAPFAGVISARNVYAGAYVGPSGKGSDRPLLTLQEQRRLRLMIDIPEAAVGYLALKDTLHFSVRTLPDSVFSATISRMAGSMNTELRTEHIEMDVANDRRGLLPGMFAQVDLVYVNSNKKTFVVPASAVASNSQQVFVIRVVGGKTQWVDIVKGRETPDSLEIYGDLHPNDQLLLKASDEIRDGNSISTTSPGTIPATSPGTKIE